MAGASKHSWLKAKHSWLKVEDKRVLQQRLIVLSTAWTVGNGHVPQPWFKLNKSRKVLHSELHAGFAAFKAEPSVKLPVGLQDAIMAENFDFGGCLKRFGLNWERAKAQFTKGCLTEEEMKWAEAIYKGLRWEKAEAIRMRIRMARSQKELAKKKAKLAEKKAKAEKKELAKKKASWLTRARECKEPPTGYLKVRCRDLR